MRERAIIYFYLDKKMMSLGQVKSVLQDAKVEKEFKRIDDKMSQKQKATNQELDFYDLIHSLKWMENYIERKINEAKGGKPNTSN